MTETPSRRDTALAYWFSRSGLTQRRLAAEVGKRARAAGLRIHPDGTRVRRWLEGERPRPPVPQFVAEVLSAHCGRTLTPADLGLDDDQQDDLARYRGPHDLLATLAQTTPPPHRSTGLPPAAVPWEPERLLEALHTWAFTTARPLPAQAGPGQRLGEADVARIRDCTAAFRALDNAHGGGSTLAAAASHLAATTHAVRDGTYTDRTGRLLLRELADLAGVAGWAAHDAAHWPHAIRYLTLAVHAARDSADTNLTAHLLQCLARVWGYLKRPDVAADCIALALYGCRHHAQPALRAGLHALAARFAAMQGQTAEVLRNVSQAQDIFDHTPNAPAYVAYLDEPELASTLGEVMLFLARTTGEARHATTAVTLLDAAAAHRNPTRVRSRAFDAIAAARAFVLVGDVDAAHTYAQHAINVATGLDSTRVKRRFLDLAHEITPAAGTSPNARELRAQLCLAAGVTEPDQWQQGNR
ncbi:hypothetical protein LX15_004939 [Streptoalloteichus tenebrarius]|uniref:Uncharacterized protein n=1 Tax=Streptoalloteichus tenebrarius (strain ATCC 17920 / DSM 40477 / JCM 4838 / CBS 697.72 / NBRC 16177 / NCIMB 11028 / NRRL B-12390 / A12253. 1 / ISP 5477) TaxID=1933 RepID=A0ABT1I0E4_STRSD|nr:hypothetical protein [Streptoalloteichus tenebrarius]MCP2261218.1 hypothetical protein [Streptoalloteichus tenebrarius]